jgi:hypothetical protein
MEVMAVMKSNPRQPVHRPRWIVRTFDPVKATAVDGPARVVRRNGHGLVPPGAFYRQRHPDAWVTAVSDVRVRTGQRAVDPSFMRTAKGLLLLGALLVSLDDAARRHATVSSRAEGGQAA